MTPDSELLRRYAETKSEGAFAELVQRHLNLVYSAALRQVNGDAHLAQDIAQTVFSDLARKAASLSRRATISGWLYTSAHFAAAKTVRTEQRRHAREREAHIMRELLHDSPSDGEWEELGPTLDVAMHELNEADREVILLRYFENQQLAAIGARLGTNEDAARKRISRALEKLRARLVRRGVTTTAAALSIAISTNAVQIAPAGLAAILTSASLATAAIGTGTTLTLVNLMNITNLKLGIVTALVAVGVATPLLVQHRAEVRLREKDEALQEQTDRLMKLSAENERLANLLSQAKDTPKPRLPAPPMQSSVQDNSPLPDSVQSSNLLRLLKGETPKLTSEQIEAYLKANQRNASSLLAVFRANKDKSFLKEAEEKFPNDPRVAFAAVFESDSPEAHRQWLDTFKRSAPDNAMANYLSALDYFKSGQTDQAVQELLAASGKQDFQDYSWDFVQNSEEAWRAAGYPEAETSMIATWDLLLPHDSGLKNLGQKIVDLAGSYRQAGDEASALAALQIGLNLGQQMSASPTDPLINHLVGIAIQRMALSAMDPNSLYAGGQTVQNRLDQLVQQKALISDLVKQMEPLQPMMTPQDWLSYNSRTRSFGEENAIRWLLDKYRQK